MQRGKPFIKKLTRWIGYALPLKQLGRGPRPTAPAGQAILFTVRIDVFLVVLRRKAGTPEALPLAGVNHTA